MAKNFTNVLTIAGTDSSGISGIAADIKTISACGCYAECVVTAVTAQNTIGIYNIYEIPSDVIKAQIKADFDDLAPEAVKIGMMSNPEIMESVAYMLKTESPTEKIVLDPIMVSTTGYVLMHEQNVNTLKNVVMPHVKLITPNIDEANVLTGKKITSIYEFEDFARRLSQIAGNSVLLKAGHFSDGDLDDLLYNVETDIVTRYHHDRIKTKNLRGTGCTLSSAIASFWAKGNSLENSVQLAEDFLLKAIISAVDYETGHGAAGPVNHFGI